ncbi:MAG: PEGA domain-containing protein [Sandaracinaceae bacterium]
MRGATALLVTLCSLSATLARAQDEDPRVRAQRHFEQALSLFDEGHLDRALVEFEAAYRAVPDPRLLYNIGNVYAALDRSVEAVDAYERYLAAVNDVDEARREEVDAALRRHRARVGRVTFEVNVEGATIVVDGVDVGSAPLSEPVRVVVGEHDFSARATGYDEPRVRVAVAGGADVTVPLTLHAAEVARSILRVSSVPAGVTILVGGREVGVTPLDETVVVEPGDVTVIGRRAGYLEGSRTVAAVAGGEASVRLELEPDRSAAREDRGRLRLDAPLDGASLEVDGREVALHGATLELPVGPHDVILRVPSRREVRETIAIPSDDELVFAPTLTWTDDAARDAASAAETQRTVGWVLAVSGAVLLAAAIPTMIWNETSFADYESLYPQFRGPMGCITLGRDCALDYGMEVERRFFDLERQELTSIRVFTILGAALGATGLAVGLAVALTAAEPHDTGDDVRARLRIGPGSIALEGSFR